MKKKKDAVCIALILALYTVLAIAGIGCPIKFMTGISCPGCGMTRAWLSVLHIDFGSAFAFHPLFWILPVVFLIIFFPYTLSYVKSIIHFRCSHMEFKYAVKR